MSKLTKAPPTVAGFTENLAGIGRERNVAEFDVPIRELIVGEDGLCCVGVVDAPSVSLAVVKMPVSRGKSLEKLSSVAIRPPVTCRKSGETNPLEGNPR